MYNNNNIGNVKEVILANIIVITIIIIIIITIITSRYQTLIM